jgi:hypothetical protein
MRHSCFYEIFALNIVTDTGVSISVRSSGSSEPDLTLLLIKLSSRYQCASIDLTEFDETFPHEIR